MNDAEIFQSGHTAVITGAGLGIGRAAAAKLAGLGMSVCLVDLASEDLEAAAAAAEAKATGGARVIARPTDVADMAAMTALAEAIQADLGPVSLLINNAATRVGRGMWADLDAWRRLVDVNLWGVIHGVRAFGPAMIANGAPGRIVVVGSKQGITNPPGHPAYNMVKAALKSYAEGLAHDLRNGDNPAVTAHLLIPGWTTTGRSEHKPGAWLPEQVIGMMIDRVRQGDFYIVCPDGETPPEADRKRILWSALDITENRPALSRWQGEYNALFDAFTPD